MNSSLLICIVLLLRPLEWTSASQPQPQTRSEALRAVLDEHVEALLQDNPISVGPALGDDRFNDRLQNVSVEAYAQRRTAATERLALLSSLDRAEFTDEDHLDADLLTYQLQLGLDGALFHPEQTPVSSQSGPQYWLPQLGSFAPFSKPEHWKDYVSRLTGVSALIDQYIDQMQRGVAAGRVPPRVIIEPAVAQSSSQHSTTIIDDPTRSPFYQPFLNRPDDEVSARAQEVIASEVVPAYARLTAFLRDEYLPACRESFGASAGLDGAAGYQHALRTHTTLDVTPEQVHEIGLREVARIRDEMFDVIARSDFEASEGLSGDALFSAFVEYLRSDSRFYYTEADALMRDYRALTKRIDAEMPRLFERLPRLPYGVREIPSFASKASPTAYYYNGSLSGGRPGYFMVNTYALDQRPTYDMVALALHEAVPGHHLQIALAKELDGVHPFRRLAGFTAFVEGWALYAERLGLEMEQGFYDDPYADFGRLNFEMWRAMRLVVDTGLHAKDWSRDDAITYMLANSALAKQNVISEVDRYIGWPGQACAYKMGEIRIRQLRARAESRLGGAFDLRAFHDALLGAGALPLPVLERRMDRWLSAELSGLSSRVGP